MVIDVAGIKLWENTHWSKEEYLSKYRIHLSWLMSHTVNVEIVNGNH